MKLSAPGIQWPDEFDCAGPVEDPEILLRSTAVIGGVDFAMTAVRMHEGWRTPDYKDTVARQAYDDVMDQMVDDIEYLADSILPKLLTINAAHYLLWIVPASAD